MPTGNTPFRPTTSRLDFLATWITRLGVVFLSAALVAASMERAPPIHSSEPWLLFAHLIMMLAAITGLLWIDAIARHTAAKFKPFYWRWYLTFWVVLGLCIVAGLGFAAGRSLATWRDGL